MSLHIPKFRAKHKSDSSTVSSPECSTPSDIPGSDGGSPPTERAAAALVTTPDGSRPNSPTLEKVNKIGPKKGGDLSPSVAPGPLTLLEMMDTDLRPKGSASLKAYSYALPPPPSYRKLSQKKATSPVEQNNGSALGVSSGEDENAPRLVEETRDAEVNPTFPMKFESLSEETRLRLLRVSLQQKVAEKKRKEKEKEKGYGTLQVDNRLESSNGDGSLDACHANHKFSEPDVEESCSSASTSTSSSTTNSKNPSLDSLHLRGADHEPRQNSIPSAGVKNSPRSSGSHTISPQPQSMLFSEEQPRSYETSVVLVQGGGYLPWHMEPAVRPSDVQMTRENVERPRMSRRKSLDSESSESSTEDEDECALSMSKTFDEKLKILLDLDYTFGAEGAVKEPDDEVSSVSSEPQPRCDVEHEADAQATPKRRGSVQISRMMQQRDAKPVDISAVSVLRTSSADEPTVRLSSITSSASRSQELNRSESGVRVDNVDQRVGLSIPKLEVEGRTGISAVKPSGVEMVGTKTPGAEGKAEKESASPSGPSAEMAVDKRRQRSPGETRRRIGSVRTTTPVALKEFDIKTVTLKTNTGNTVRSGDPRLHLSTDRSSNLGFSRGTQRGAPAVASSRKQTNISFSSGHKHGSGALEHGSGKPLQITAKSRTLPKVVNRDSGTGTKSRLLSQKDSSRELLPSKARIADRDSSKKIEAEKLEQNAQHIAELLEEMHSERSYKMSRQRSDISGSAQKAAAQRAALRRRRRSLGDEERERVLVATRLESSTNTNDPQKNPTSHHLEARNYLGYELRNETRRRAGDSAGQRTSRTTSNTRN